MFMLHVCAYVANSDRSQFDGGLARKCYVPSVNPLYLYTFIIVDLHLQ